MKPQTSDLTEKEKLWLKVQLDGGQVLTNSLLSSQSSNQITLEILDNAYSVWFTKKVTDTQVINDTINKMGIAFGQCLADKFGFKWVIATDQFGTDLALYLPSKGDMLIYPANFLAKRWEKKETNFFRNFSEQVCKQIEIFKS